MKLSVEKIDQKHQESFHTIHKRSPGGPGVRGTPGFGGHHTEFSRQLKGTVRSPRSRLQADLGVRFRSNSFVCKSFSLVDADAPQNAGTHTGVPGYGPCVDPAPICLGAPICVSGDRRYHGFWRQAANPLHSSRTKHGAANMPTPKLQEFFGLVQGGDEGAVKAILEQLDPFLRRVIRLRLLDGHLRRAVDTTDNLHSLLKDFLRQPAGGEPAETSSAQFGT